MPVLNNSDRSILKATYVPLKPAPSDEPVPGGALDKASFARSLRLEKGEVERVSAATRDAGSADVPDEVWRVLKQFEPQSLAVLAPKPFVLASVRNEPLLAAGQAVLALRKQKLEALSADPATPGTAQIPSTTVLDRATPGPALALSTAFPDPASGGAPIPAMPVAMMPFLPAVAGAVTAAAGAVDAFKSAIQARPVGMLYLERVEMAPAGIERGELVATIPLAPGETTSVLQKEWAVTSQEFSSIVTDFLESFSEKGVTEKSELAESSESQTKHSQQMGLNASVSGSYGFITFATNASLSSASSEDQSTKASRNHASEVTEKASTRVRKEHKVTFQTTSVTGKEETSTRTLVNPSATEPMRIDYFSMMRKWRVRLLRYGLRMTYDITIPEPGATLRGLHVKLADIELLLRRPFLFELDSSLIKDDPKDANHFARLGAQYAASVPFPPANPLYAEAGEPVPGPPQQAWTERQLNVNIKDGYEIASGRVFGNFSISPGYSFHLDILGISGALPYTHVVINDLESNVVDQPLPVFEGRTGQLALLYTVGGTLTGTIKFEFHLRPTAESMDAWRAGVWQALYNAARDTFYAGQQLLVQQRDALKAEIEDVDTLTLRREEREEVMKGILRWILGPAFEFMPQEVVDVFLKGGSLSDVLKGISFTGAKTDITPTDWSVMYAHGEMIKFIMQAIEWENLLYLLYPYFWDVPAAWDFVRRFHHPDPTREAFLRAGCARVVLTIRPGWEADFFSFIENGELGKTLTKTHPYMTIGEEMKAYADTNYPGVPPANPESSIRPLLAPMQRKAWEEIQGLVKFLGQYSADHQGTPDKPVYPTTAQGLAALAKYGAVPAKDPWGNAYVYQCPGSNGDYDLSSLGADGKAGGQGDNADITSWASASLIGEWFEYTPSHGLDIAVGSKVQEIS